MASFDPVGDPWGIVGHERAVDLLRRSIRHRRIGHAYLISGPLGVGKRTLAVRLAQAWGAAPGVATRDQAGRLQVTAAQGPIVAAVIGSTDEETTHALLADALSGNVER